MGMTAEAAQSIEEPSRPGVLLRLAVRKSAHGVFWYDRWSRMLVQAPEEAEARIHVHYPPFYPAPVPLARIRQILPSMGLSEEMKVVIVAGDAIELTGQAAMDRREQVWKRSFEVAKIAEFITLWTRSETSPEDAFQAGLLHDCALAMMTRETVSYHAEAGALMAKIWDAPPAVCQAIRFHHQAGVELLEVLEEPRIWLALRLADCLHDVLSGKSAQSAGGYGVTSCFDFSGQTVDALGVLGLRVEEMRDLMADVARLIGLGGDARKV